MLFSKQKLIIALIGLLVTVLIGALVAFFGSSKKPTTQGSTPPAMLQVWGVFDTSDMIAPLTRAFHERYKHLDASYHLYTIEEYENVLLNALASGKGPDVYMVNNTWLPRYIERLKPASPLALDIKTFRDAFVDIAYEDLVANQKIYGVPLHVDTLALFYNKDYLASAGIALPPSTWEEFLAATKLLTRRDEKGNIQRAGAALGTAKNINRSFDILSLLMMQQGAHMVSDDLTRATFDAPLAIGNESFFPGERALTFYTDFANPRKQVYSWNALQDFSLDAFFQGKAAMMVNYSRVIPLIESRAPYLKWNIAPMPQIASRDTDINFGNYWALVVSSTSKYPEQSWQFLKFMTERDNAKRYADNARRPVARRDLVDVQKADEKLGVFAVQSLTARSWYQADNRAIEELFADMIESVVKGSDSAKDAIVKAARQVGVLMRKQ
ncbi:MAG: extracellular solute-binding protein [bacterium]|nr:extracellular solute-binding protein [bacterium]